MTMFEETRLRFNPLFSSTGAENEPRIHNYKVFILALMLTPSFVRPFYDRAFPGKFAPPAP